MQKKKLFNLRPIVMIALAVCFSIISAYFWVFENFVLSLLFVLLTLLSAGVIFLPVYLEFSIKEKLIFAFICLTICLVGSLSFSTAVINYQNANLNGHFYTVSAHVEQVSQTDTGNRFVLSDVQVNGNFKGKLNHKIYLYVYGESGVDVGQTIKFSATLIDKDLIYEEKFASFDLASGIKYFAEVDASDIEILNFSPTIFESVNLFLRDALRLGLDTEEFSVGYALLTGSDGSMDQDLLSSYRLAGVAHIFAVSGLHIGFLAGVLSWLFDKLKVKTLIKAFVITLILFFYSGVCGFSSSSIRASIMTAVVLFSSVGGVRYDRFSSIALAFIIILIIQPIQLFTVGFQLSFAVVTGIALLSAPISRLFKFLPKPVAESLGVVISAQLASMPISLIWFGQVSVIAVLINLIFVPAVSVIYTFLFATTILGGLFGIESVLLFIPNYVLKFVNMCISAFDYKIFLVSGLVLGVFTFFYYFVLVLLSGLINGKRLTKTCVSIVCTAVFLTGTAILTINENKSVNVYVCGSEKACVTVIDTPEENVMIVSEAKTTYSTTRLNRLSKMHAISTIDTLLFSGGNEIEIQSFVTKLRTVFAIKRICYYGEEDLGLESAVKKSFSNVEIFNAFCGDKIEFKSLSGAFALEGRAFDLTVQNKRIAVFASVVGVNYKNLSGRFDIMICGSDAQQIITFHNPNKAVCYRKSNWCDDGESQGTLKIRL